jgi:hypothetical protein
MFNFPVSMIYYFLVVGCASTQSTTTSSSTQTSKYSEDLSGLRPKIETTETPTVNPADDRKATPYVEPQFAINKQVDAVLDSIDRLNGARKFVEGYTIQVYSGLKREDALNAKKTLSTSFPTIESEVQYNQPNFRVKAGKYYDRMNAQRDFLLVKRLFPSAIVIPDKFAAN